MSEATSSPTRRIVMDVTIQADDRTALLACLEAIRNDINQGVLGRTSGGAGGYGYEAKISDDGVTTPEQYQESLRDFLECHRREGC